MSDRLLWESDVLKALEDGVYTFYDCDVLDRIRAIPSVNKMQCEWTENVLRPNVHRYECSNCKAHHMARYDYCPSCGAQMKGASNEGHDI